MAHHDIIAPKQRTEELPAVRTISLNDLKSALGKGYEDFKAMPTHVIFLVFIYPVVGILLIRATFQFNIIPLLFPLAAGFALVGPIAAIGLYELSRRRERGLNTSWSHIFDVFYSPSFKSIVALALLLLAIFVVWVAVAQSIYIDNFGYGEPSSLSGFVTSVLTTPEGHRMIFWGMSTGFCFALLVLVLSVVSFPLLLDRDVGFASAVLTSIRTIIRNPIVMSLWGVIIAVGLLIGSLPFFLGLAIVLPILGHATWHLYRIVIEPDPNARPEFVERPKAPRYAAQFPISLLRFRNSEDDSDND